MPASAYYRARQRQRSGVGRSSASAASGRCTGRKGHSPGPPARDSLTFARLTSKRLPPSVPLTCLSADSRTVPCAALRSGDANGRRLQFVVADRERARQRDAVDEREATQRRRRGGQPRVAAAQATEARAAGEFGLGLQRRRDDLAIEVDDRVEHGRERAPGLAAQARRRVHVGEPSRRQGRRREHVRRGACTAARGAPAKNALTAACAQPLKSLPSTEWPV